MRNSALHHSFYLLLGTFKITDMKERKGYKRKLLETTISEWTGLVRRKWEYTWSDGTKEIRFTVKTQ